MNEVGATPASVRHDAEMAGGRVVRSMVNNLSRIKEGGGRLTGAGMGSGFEVRREAASSAKGHIVAQGPSMLMKSPNTITS
jgi:hypothetical protein